MIPPSVKSRLLRQKPYLSIYFENLPEKNQYSLQNLSSSHEQSPVIIYQTKDRSIQLSSRYNPQKEIQQMFSHAGEVWDAGEIILILGLGNIDILPAVFARLKKNQICIAIDASLYLGQLLCQQSSLMWEFLLRPGSHLFCGIALERGLKQYVESLPIEAFSGIQFLRHHPSIRLQAEFYNQIEKKLHDLIKTRISDLLTRIEFETLWVKNILANSSHLPMKNHTNARLYTVRGYKDSLHKKPGVLIASGPSLQESFAELHVLKERAFLLCVDSALKVLLKAGITPHGVITLDAQAHTFFAFSGLDLSDIVLFADLVSNPTIFRKIKTKKVIFSTTAQISYDYAGELKQEFTRGTEFAQKIHGDIGYLQSGGSVATSGLDLLRTLGCDPILFIGLDQAYTDRKIHSNGSHHGERWLPSINRTKTVAGIIENIVRKRQTFLVPAIDGDEILSDYILDLYKGWFESSIPNCSEKIYQLTRRGASLQSAIPVSDPYNFALALEKQENITKPFAFSPKLDYFLHPDLQELVYELQKNPQTKTHDEIEREKVCTELEILFHRYPFLQFASRRAELYIKRNAKKISPEEAKMIWNEKTLSILKKLERSICSLTGRRFI